jgi:hypothetical protein
MSRGNWLFIPTAALETHPTLTLPDGNSVNFDKYVLRESIFYSEDKDGMQRRTRREDMEPSKPTPKKQSHLKRFSGQQRAISVKRLHKLMPK